MLKSFTIHNVAEFRDVEMSFGSRLNVITGDNSLGKSVLLDLVWKAKTDSWRDGVFVKRDEDGGVRFCDNNFNRDVYYEYNHISQPGDGLGLREDFDEYVRYLDRIKRNLNLYIDPNACANLSLKYHGKPILLSDRILVYEMNNKEIWDGKENDDYHVSQGLIADIMRWRMEDDPAATLLENVLKELSPVDEPLTFAKRSVRPFPHDARYVPALTSRYGDTPVTLASAAVKRILSIAYLLVWSRMELIDRLGEEQGRKAEISLLIDEVEAHLHPQWQRKILPSLLSLADKTGLFDTCPQIFITTHSPMVLASLEPHVDPARDKLFHLKPDPNADGRAVTVEELDWEKYGDISGWMTSEVFGLGYAGSFEIERLRADITALHAQDDPDPERIDAISARVRTLLSSADILRTDWFSWVARRAARGRAQ